MTKPLPQTIVLGLLDVLEHGSQPNTHSWALYPYIYIFIYLDIVLKSWHVVQEFDIIKFVIFIIFFLLHIYRRRKIHEQQKSRKIFTDITWFFLY